MRETLVVPRYVERVPLFWNVKVSGTKSNLSASFESNFSSVSLSPAKRVPRNQIRIFVFHFEGVPHLGTKF